MRNLKKVLALALVMALAMTMFAGAFAAPMSKTLTGTDKLSAAGKNALDVVTSLKIMNGYPDGSFGGEKTITRAEFLTMLYRATTGKETVESYFETDVSEVFVDVSKGDWSLGYLNWAYAKGITVGYVDAKGVARFAPNQAVTNTEAAKMILVALGYDPEIEGFQFNANWRANVVKIGTVAGIFNALTGPKDSSMTREDAAIMFTNALYSKTVKYLAGSYQFNDTTWAQEVYDLLDVEAVYVANDYEMLGAYWRTGIALQFNYDGAYVVTNRRGANRLVNVNYKLYDEAYANTSFFVYQNYVTTNGYSYYEQQLICVEADGVFAELGHKYRLFTTEGSAKYNDIRALYGAPIEVAESNTYDVVKANAKNFPDTAKINMIYDETRINDTNPDGTVWFNGEPVSFDDIVEGYDCDIEDYLAINSTAPQKMIDNNGDGIYDHLFVTHYTFAQVEFKNDTNYWFTNEYCDGNESGSTKVKIADCSGDELAAGDYVMYYYNDAEGIYHVKKMTVLVGNVSKYDGTYFYIGENKYELSHYIDNYSEEIMDESEWAVTKTQLKFVIDEDATDKFIVRVLLDETTKFEKYAVVLGYNDDANAVQLFTEDNAKVTYKVTHLNGLPVKQISVQTIADFVPQNKLVNYEVNANGVAIYTAEAYKALYVPQTGWVPYYNYNDTFDHANKFATGYWYSDEYEFAYKGGYWYAYTDPSFVNMYYETEWNLPAFPQISPDAMFAIKNTNGVEFVTFGYYDSDLFGNPYKNIEGYNYFAYRAYQPGDFKPNSNETSSGKNLVAELAKYNYADMGKAFYPNVEPTAIYSDEVFGKAYNTKSETLVAGKFMFEFAANQLSFRLPSTPIINKAGTVYGVLTAVNSYSLENINFTLASPWGATTKYDFALTVANEWYGINYISFLNRFQNCLVQLTIVEEKVTDITLLSAFDDLQIYPSLDPEEIFGITVKNGVVTLDLDPSVYVNEKVLKTSDKVWVYNASTKKYITIEDLYTLTNKGDWGPAMLYTDSENGFYVLVVNMEYYIN